MTRLARTIATTLSALLLSGIAEAHPKLLSASPRADAVIVSPKTVELRFSEKLVGAFSGIELAPALAGGKAMKLTSKIGPDGRALSSTLVAPLAPGRYRVNWHAVSVDTHRVQGSYPFMVR